MTQPWTRVGTALVTPFTADGAVDEAAVRRLARRQIEEGVHFLVPCGTTGESPTLTHEEHLRVVELVVEEARGAVPVLAGAGGYNTHEVAHLARELEDLGVQGILSVTPYHNKPTQEGLVRHYERSLPDTAADHRLQRARPTGCNVEPRTLARSRRPQHRGRQGSVRQHDADVRGLPPRARDFIVLSGDDALALPLMAVGGRGIISVASNVVPGHGEDGQAAERAISRPPEPITGAHRFMLVNFVESNPDPGEVGDGDARTAARKTYRLPMVPPSDASRETRLGRGSREATAALVVSFEADSVGVPAAGYGRRPRSPATTSDRSTAR